MTTATAVPTAVTDAPSSGVKTARLLRSEWTKLVTVRSTLWSLLLLVILTPGLSALLTWLNEHNWAKADPSTRASIIDDPTSFILGTGLAFGQLTICVLGVLVMAGEYSTGSIRSSLLAVPKRTSMLAAKCAVFAFVVFIFGEIVAFPSFLIGAKILHNHVPVSLGDTGVLRAVIGGGLYLAVLGLFALAIGALVRHTAGAITGVIAFVLVLAPLAQLLPGSLGKHVHAYLPSEAGHLIAQAHQAKGDLLSPWQGFGVFCLWTALLLGLAAWLLNRRDA
jgi:ABC-2 type transport system permease protein